MRFNYLLNFSVSYTRGGLKRLVEYAKWFNANGGAYFIVHPNCGNLATEFPDNRFFVVNQSKFSRIFNDCAYLSKITEQTRTPDLYYSYGIPIYKKIGRLNWFHLSNVLPLYSTDISLPVQRKIELRYLGHLIKSNVVNAEIISAESEFSLDLIRKFHAAGRLVLSVNGSDDEIDDSTDAKSIAKDNIATVVGTIRYKSLMDSYGVFKTLQRKNPGLVMVLIGDREQVPGALFKQDDVLVTGRLSRRDVCNYLKKSKYYISTTLIENSYNAASEGIFFSDESYISDIGPHRELLKDNPFEIVHMDGVSAPLFHVKRSDLSKRNLRSWNEVIRDMIKIAREFTT